MLRTHPPHIHTPPVDVTRIYIPCRSFVVELLCAFLNAKTSCEKTDCFVVFSCIIIYTFVVKKLLVIVNVLVDYHQKRNKPKAKNI